MKIRHINSSCVIIESNKVKILCDPWFVSGEYYGSWHIYPSLDLEEDFFNDIDYIYVSHIHPDHFSRKSFLKLKKDIPVLIHAYDSPFLKMNIERMGFNVTELPHNKKTLLKNDVSINILAADNCNPELCAKFMGCGIVETDYKSTQIDSLCIISDNNYSILNTNDCPYDLSYQAIDTILDQYKKIDFLLVGYGGAGPYPQCFDLPDEERAKAEEEKIVQFLSQAESYINQIKPDFYMPFAGTYTLAGNLYNLDERKAVPDVAYAKEYLTNSNIINNDSKCILLNTNSYFDLSVKKQSKKYTPIDLNEKKIYMKEVLSKIKLDYENEKEPKIKQIKELIEPAYSRMEYKRKEIEFSSDTIWYLMIDDNNLIEVSMNGSGFNFVTKINHDKDYIVYKLDSRLLFNILQGPRYAHWNNAEIGSHIKFKRNPNKFERGIYHSINFFHS
ncbi:MAG: Zn-dependent hydrolase [Flavobacteriaceae bacterium]|nr:Zn-dependent hydrolase [Flavobacteriaceae bacterium]